MKRSLVARSARRGFTLVEMLVALAVTLIMMGAVVSLFGVISESVAAARSGIEMADRLRAARDVIQTDLRGVTATMNPPLRPENDEGYFEIIEGVGRDFDSAAPLRLFGDVDDVLMFTTRSPGPPFVGRYNNQPILESQLAEVVYFVVLNGPVIDATQNPPTRLGTLYRRVLLVSPSTPVPGFDSTFLTHTDLSVRYVDGATPELIPNTLGDLTKRENRFAHTNVGHPSIGNDYMRATFPFLAVPTYAPSYSRESTASYVQPTVANSWPNQRPKENAFIGPMGDNPWNATNTARLGDDVLLSNVLAFDVQVWDPGAPIFVDTASAVALEPRDPGYQAPSSTTPRAFGAFADLGYATPTYALPPGSPAPWFNVGMLERSQLSGPPFVYDTWSLHYEANGDNEEDYATANGITLTVPDAGTDTGTNGLDDNGDGLVDDVTEYDTHPPYDVPLRGIRITLRVYEPNSKQVREAVIVQDFRTK